MGHDVAGVATLAHVQGPLRATGPVRLRVAWLMRFVINLTVSSADEGKTLLDWLVYHLVDETRSDVLRALKAGRVAINRRPVQDPNHRLVAGAEVGYQEAGDAPDAR